MVLTKIVEDPCQDPQGSLKIPYQDLQRSLSGSSKIFENPDKDPQHSKIIEDPQAKILKDP